MAEDDWFRALSGALRIRFEESDFLRHLGEVEADLALFRTWIPAEGRILDLGCGPGDMAVPLSKLGYRVVGVDADPRVCGSGDARAAPG